MFLKLASEDDLIKKYIEFQKRQQEIIKETKEKRLKNNKLKNSLNDQSNNLIEFKEEQPPSDYANIESIAKEEYVKEEYFGEEDWELLSNMFNKTEAELKEDYLIFLEDKFKGSFIEYEFTLGIAEESLSSKPTEQIKSNKDQKERKYVGEMINGKPNGLGTETYENGNNYSGQWKNGKFHGQGIYTNNIYGQTFEGEWNEGYFSRGTMIYSKGINGINNDEKYIGEVAYSFGYPVPHGQGVFYSKNGDIYKGEFYDFNKSGKGTLTWANGDIYEGDWSKNSKWTSLVKGSSKYDLVSFVCSKYN